MERVSDQSRWDRLCRLAQPQHWVVSIHQLSALGFSEHHVRRLVEARRLYPVGRDIYSVGRPGLTKDGRWQAVLLSCGSTSALSHSSGAALLKFGEEQPGVAEVTVPYPGCRARPGVIVHRRKLFHPSHIVKVEGLRVIRAELTLIDIANRLSHRQLEAAINRLDDLGLADPPALRSACDAARGRIGVAKLRDALDRRTFRLTRSELERRFKRIAAQAGLPVPQTRVWLNGFEVDFYWPPRLVVEADSLTYHRTPAQQARDRLRDQAHTAAGLTTLRFTHEQVRYEPQHVIATLRSVWDRLERAA